MIQFPRKHARQAIKNKRRRITLGMLSFGKLALWADLDTKKNTGLTDHELIKSVFSGGSGGGDGGLHARTTASTSGPRLPSPSSTALRIAEKLALYLVARRFNVLRTRRRIGLGQDQYFFNLRCHPKFLLLPPN